MEVTLGPSTADTWFTSINPDSTLGASPTISVGYASTTIANAVVSFDLSSIPTWASISSASLVLYNDAITGNHITGPCVYSVYNLSTSDWVETEATWNKRKRTDTWGSSGGDYSTSPVSSLTVSDNTAQYRTWDVKDHINSWLSSGTANLLIRLSSPIPTTQDSFLRFVSRSGAVEARRPYLVINYSSVTGRKAKTGRLYWDYETSEPKEKEKTTEPDDVKKETTIALAVEFMSLFK